MAVSRPVGGVRNCQSCRLFKSIAVRVERDLANVPSSRLSMSYSDVILPVVPGPAPNVNQVPIPLVGERASDVLIARARSRL